MAKQRAIDFEIQFVNVLGEMVQAYQEIYVVKMKKVRDRVLQNRNYMEGLTEVFGELKQAYARELKEKKGTSVSEKISSLLDKKDNPVAVLMTAKGKLSGDINHKVFSEFCQFIDDHEDSDIVIVGSIGKDLYKQRGYTREYKFFDLREDQIDIKDLKPVIEYIAPYEQTMIFYGKYSSLVTQNQMKSDIRGHENESQSTEKEADDKKYYLFEPTLEELLVFFETQIFASLFKQTAHESYLAQIGSRIQALQAATSNIENRMSYLSHEGRKLLKRKRNKKQLQSLAGMRLWTH